MVLNYELYSIIGTRIFFHASKDLPAHFRRWYLLPAGNINEVKSYPASTEEQRGAHKSQYINGTKACYSGRKSVLFKIIIIPAPHRSWMSSTGTFTGIYRGQAGSVRRLVRRERGRVRNSTLVGRWLGGGHAKVQVSQEKIQIARFASLPLPEPMVSSWSTPVAS